jgi:uncharacterized HAD superfamily protein
METDITRSVPTAMSPNHLGRAFLLGWIKCVTLAVMIIPGESPRMPTSLRIGIDVDDVLTESLPGYLEAFQRYFACKVRIEEAAWEIFRRYPQISPTQMGGFFAELEATDFLGTRPVYPEAVGAIRRLAAAGHRLVVVTGRLMIHQEHTRRLLRDSTILHCFEELVHRDGETAEEYKPRIARERRLDLLIEDELHVAVATARIPIPVLLFDRPWNQGDLPGGVTRVREWEQVLRFVDSLAQVLPRPLQQPDRRLPG